MEITTYSDIYKNGVMKTLKNNYTAFNQMSEEELSKFIESITNYSWIDSVKDVPFRRGLVLIDNEEIKGFFGLIYSKHLINGKEYLSVNPTTWAIDKDYRIYLFSVMQKVNESADFVVDLTSTKTIEKISLKMFKYKIYDEYVYKYFVLPVFHKKVHVKSIVSANDVIDEKIKKLYLDHIKYNVKCVKVDKNGEAFYVFYYVKKRKLRNIFNTKWIYILFVSDISLFNGNTGSLFKWLSRYEKANFFVIDSRYVNKEKFRKKPLKIERRTRIVLNKSNVEFDDCGNLYSEIPITTLQY